MGGFDLLNFEDTFPAQVGLLGIQLLWTRDAEEALANAKYDRSVMEKANKGFKDLLTTQTVKFYARLLKHSCLTSNRHNLNFYANI